MTTALQLLTFALGIICFSVTQLIMHGKLKWMTEADEFWGKRSDLRKYSFPIKPPLENWYYRFFKIKYKERWPTSATMTVMFTDSYHMLQSIQFVCFALSLSLSTHINFFILWAGLVGVHAVTYSILSK